MIFFFLHFKFVYTKTASMFTEIAKKMIKQKEFESLGSCTFSNSRNHLFFMATGQSFQQVNIQEYTKICSF